MDKTLKEKLDQWIDKAEDITDDIKHKIDEYIHKTEDVTDKLEDDVKEFGKEIKTEAGNAAEEVQEIAKLNIERIDNRLEELRDTGKYSFSISDERWTEIEQRADVIKEHIRQEAIAAQEQIGIRKDRFAEGLESIMDDITNRSEEKRREERIRTSPIDENGVYHAADEDGTPNNYFDRIEKHTKHTIERMRKDVEQTADKMLKMTEELENVYSV